MASLAIGVLAAGSSKRLGQPKQLVDTKGVSLLQHQVNVASATGFPVYVVLGEQPEAKQMAAQLNVPLLTNANWASGMASSIHCLIKNTVADAWLFLTVDQYRLSTAHLNAMISHWQNSNTSRTIVASTYNAVLGVPALIPAHYKNALLDLSGDQGAGRFMRQAQLENPETIITIENPELNYDVDTVDDLLTLQTYFQRP
jgi:molybdenum cofactor cytidylyltransferase